MHLQAVPRFGEENDNQRSGKGLKDEEHLSECERLRVRNRQERTARVQVGHAAGSAAMKLQLRRTAWRAHDFNVAPQHALRVTGAERLHCGFFCREPAREMGCRVPPPRRVRDLPLGEYAAEEPIAVPRDGRFDPIDFGCIHAETDNVCGHVRSTA